MHLLEKAKSGFLQQPESRQIYSVLEVQDAHEEHEGASNRDSPAAPEVTLMGF